MQCNVRVECCAFIGLLYGQSGCSRRELTLSLNQVTRAPHCPSDSHKHGATGAIVAGEISRLEKAEQVQYTGG